MQYKKILFSCGGRFAALVVLCSILGFLALTFLKPPFAWFFIVLALAALMSAVLIRRNAVIYAAMIAMPLFAVGAFMEFHLDAIKYGTPAMQYEGTYRSNWNYKDPVRGYGPKPEAAQVRSRAARNGKLIYDVTYTSNAQGWRVTPQHPDARIAVIFFGCSFTFGEGVEDAESYPWQVAQQLGPEYQVFNFGFHGYGAHHFLASVENAMVDDILRRYPVVHMYYLNLARHELRSGGYSAWDENGPRYVLENGRAVRRGNFEHWYNRDGWESKVHYTFSLSHLYKDIVLHPRESQLESLRQVDAAIIAKARDVLHEKKADASFTVLAYPGAEKSIPVLAKAGLEAVNTTPFFPDSPRDAKYEIQGDGHPTAEAYRVLAEGIVHHLRGK